MFKLEENRRGKKIKKENNKLKLQFTSREEVAENESILITNTKVKNSFFIILKNYFSLLFSSETFYFHFLSLFFFLPRKKNPNRGFSKKKVQLNSSLFLFLKKASQATLSET